MFSVGVTGSRNATRGVSALNGLDLTVTSLRSPASVSPVLSGILVSHEHYSASWTNPASHMEEYHISLGLSLARTATSRCVQPSCFSGSITASSASAGVLLMADRWASHTVRGRPSRASSETRRAVSLFAMWPLGPATRLLSDGW